MGLDACAAGLNEEGEDVADHEDLCEPLQADERVLLSIEDANDAAEGHVDGRSVQSGCDKNEEALHDVESQALWIRVG